MIAKEQHEQSLQHRKRKMQANYTKYKKEWVRQKTAIKVTVEPETAQTAEKILIVVGDAPPGPVKINIKNTYHGDLTLQLFEKLYDCSNIILEDKHGLCSSQNARVLKKVNNLH
ncbi:uncharacterized protein LOC108665470 [Hyalella azteca]|uniref:Uncharacterized protein LOC108665470 n=1 Tax=Hyalella azteca TaxID=294128 RepID=A0A8B7N3A4_HYAAZ|nr:uncharacterized protein LOC108665470 [Hyalella azteca]